MKILNVISGGAVFMGLAAFVPAAAATLQPPDSEALVAGYQIIQFDLKECRAIAARPDNPANGTGIVLPDIKKIAAKMCHSALEYKPKLEALAKEKDFTLPTQLPYELNARYAALIRNKSGDFSQQYLQDQINSHEDALAVFQEEVATGKDPDVKAAAAAVIPVIQKDLDALKSVAAK